MTYQFHNQDCLEAMRLMPDNAFSLALVDPPYGIGVGKMAFTQEESQAVLQKNGSRLTVKREKYNKSDWDNKPPTEEYFSELKRVSKHQIIFGANYFGLPINLTWDKMVNDGVSFKKYEYAYASMIAEPITFVYMWAGFCQGKSIKEPHIQQGNKKLNEKRIHPCHKPIMLYKWLLKNYAKEGDTILDTHTGSGSSIIACMDMGFDITAYELDADYYKAACKRIEDYKAVLTQRLPDIINPVYHQKDIF